MTTCAPRLCGDNNPAHRGWERARRRRRCPRPPWRRVGGRGVGDRGIKRAGHVRTLWRRAGGPGEASFRRLREVHRRSVVAPTLTRRRRLLEGLRGVGDLRKVERVGRRKGGVGVAETSRRPGVRRALGAQRECKARRTWRGAQRTRRVQTSVGARGARCEWHSGASCAWCFVVLPCTASRRNWRALRMEEVEARLACNDSIWRDRFSTAAVKRLTAASISAWVSATPTLMRKRKKTKKANNNKTNKTKKNIIRSRKIRIVTLMMRIIFFRPKTCFSF